MAEAGQWALLAAELRERDNDLRNSSAQRAILLARYEKTAGHAALREREMKEEAARKSMETQEKINKAFRDGIEYAQGSSNLHEEDQTLGKERYTKDQSNK